MRKLGTRLARLEKGSATVLPMFALLDPFGFTDIPMSIIERIMQHQHLEEYIMAETSFRRTGYREHVLHHLERTHRISVTTLNPDRKQGEYMETDLIHFV